MARYEAEIMVWPHSTGRGAETDQKAAGDRMRTLVVTANDFAAALATVQTFVAGIETNPAVWQAPIYSLKRRD